VTRANLSDAALARLAARVGSRLHSETAKWRPRNRAPGLDRQVHDRHRRQFPVFTEGFVTYSNEAKTRALGVPLAALKRSGAVSEAVARAMALGALRRAGAQRRSP